MIKGEVKLSTHWAEAQTALNFWTTQEQKQEEGQDLAPNLLEKMLEERQDLLTRLELVFGKKDASETLEQCYGLDSEEMVRRIVDRFRALKKHS